MSLGLAVVGIAPTPSMFAPASTPAFAIRELSFLVLAIVTVINVARSLRRGERAGSDPWHAWTLEWATASPPPPYNFETAPVVESRRLLWDLKHPDDPDGPHE